MKENTRFTNVVLLISVFGFLVVATHGYVVCLNDLFSEPVAACQTPIFLLFTSNLNAHPFLVIHMRIFYFQRTNLYTPCLRY